MKRKIIISLMICIICAISYYFIFRDKDLYEGYKYNITPQVEFLNNVLKKEYGNKYKIYTALFNDDDEIPDIGEYDENAILWLGKKEFKITPDLPKNIAKFGKILVADFQKLRVIEYIFKKKAYQFPEFVVNNIIKERKPNYYALVGNPLYVKDYLDDNNLKYKKYSYAKLDDLRKDLSEIKAIFIEQDYNPNFNMDTVFLEAIANGIIVAENKVKDLTSPQALVGEIVEYYFNKDELVNIIDKIENNKLNEKIINNKDWILKHFTKETTQNRLLNIINYNTNDINITEFFNFCLWVKGGYHITGDLWLSSDAVNKFSKKNKWFFSYSDSTYIPTSFIQIILVGSIHSVDQYITSKNPILWLAFPYIKDNIDFDEYMQDVLKLTTSLKKIVVSSQKMQKYLIDNGIDAKFIPQLTNTDKFYKNYDENKKSDILFVGSNHYERKIVNLAKKYDMPITIYGPRWPKDWAKAPYIDNRILRKYYSSAKIVLNSQLEKMKEFGIISNRVFDATACGTMVVSEWVDEIKEVYGDCVPMYKTEEEFVDIINYYLTHDKEREEKAKCAQKITLENFTSDIVAKKFDKLIEEIKMENM